MKEPERDYIFEGTMIFFIFVGIVAAIGALLCLIFTI